MTRDACYCSVSDEGWKPTTPVVDLTSIEMTRTGMSFWKVGTARIAFPGPRANEKGPQVIFAFMGPKFREAIGHDLVSGRFAIPAMVGEHARVRSPRASLDIVSQSA